MTEERKQKLQKTWIKMKIKKIRNNNKEGF